MARSAGRPEGEQRWTCRAERVCLPQRNRMPVGTRRGGGDNYKELVTLFPTGAINCIRIYPLVIQRDIKN